MPAEKRERDLKLKSEHVRDLLTKRTDEGAV